MGKNAVRSLRAAWPVAIGVAFVLWTLASGDAQVLQSTTWVVYGVLALSLTFVWGKAGIFSFAQAAFFGIGGYAYCLCAGNVVDTTNETLSSVVVAMVVASTVAVVLGYVIFYGRLASLPVAVVTLAFSLLLVTIMGGLANPEYRIGDVPFGGYNGISAVPLTLPGIPGTPLPVVILGFVTAVAVGSVLLIAWLLARPFGRVVVAVAMNDDRAELLGYNVRAVRLRAFVVGAAMAGLAGALYAATVFYIDPSLFGLSQAALVVVWVMVGGRTSLTGAFAGVLLVESLTSSLGGAGADYGPIVLGLVLILVVLALSAGIVPSLGAGWRWWRGRGSEVVAGARPAAVAVGPIPVPPHAEGGASLTTENLVKRYGGLEVLRGVTVTFDAEQLHAVVGPNGAGKSTLLGSLMGHVKADGGAVRLGDEEITKLPTYQRARRGLALKRQVASVFMDLSVRENLWLAAYADLGSAAGAQERASQVEAWLGLEHASALPASTLSHGHRQMLEIGMVLAVRPRVLLLDEPTAGMTVEETRTIARLVRSIADHLTVVVVEHDMQFIRDLDAPVTVLDRGAVLTRGAIDELRRDERVINVYLGRTHA